MNKHYIGVNVSTSDLPSVSNDDKLENTNTNNFIADNPKKAKRKISRGFWFALLKLIFIASLLSSLAYIGYYAYMYKQELTQALSDVNNRVTRLAVAEEEQEQELVEKSSALEGRLKSLEEELTSNQEELKQLQAKVQHALDSADELWLLLEAEYLLKTANNRLQVTDNVLATTKQLEIVRSMLGNLNHDQVVRVITALDKDIQEVAKAKIIDKPRAILEVNNMLNNLMALNINEILVFADKPMQTASKQELSGSNWRKFLSSSWSELRDLIKVRRNENKDRPIALALDERVERLQSLRLFLEQAKWSLLQDDIPGYRKSLQESKSILQHSFLKDEMNVAGMLDNIETLLSESDNLTKPKLKYSLTAIEDAVSFFNIKLNNRGN